jgi:hypothetical protein
MFKNSGNLFQKTGDSIEDKVSSIHPDLQEVLGDLKLIDDISNDLKWVKNEYLPIEVDEETYEHEERLNRVSFRNFFSHLVNGYGGLLSFSIENEDNIIAEDNIDLRGNSIYKFFSMATKRSLKDRLCGIFIEAPPEDKNIKTNKDLMNSNRRPWLNLILRSNIRNWKEAVVNGDRVFTMVVLREPRWISVGQYGMRLKELFRVLELKEWTKEGRGGPLVTYRVIEIAEDGTEFVFVNENGQPEEGYYPNLSKIPLVIFDAGLDNADDDSSVMAGRPPFIGYAEANIEHLQLKSERRESLHKTGQAMLARGWPGMPPPDAPKVKMGSRYVIDYPVGGEVSYLETSGNGIAEMREAIKEIESALDAASVSVLTGSAPAETVVAALLRSAQGTANLKSMALSLKSVIQSVFEFYTAYLGVENNIEITVNDKVLEPPADHQTGEFIRDLHTVDGLIDQDTMFMLLKKVKILPNDFDIEAASPDKGEEPKAIAGRAIRL